MTVVLKEYFELAGAMLGIYGIFRVIIWMELRHDFQPPPPSEPSNIQNQPIDTSQLAQRLEDVRRDYAAEAQARPPWPRKPLLVEERRAEIAKRAFFQKPAPSEPEPPEQEQGLSLLTF